MPSMSPSNVADAPNVPTTNSGNTPWIISEEISMNIDTNPNIQTPRGIFLNMPVPDSLAIATKP
jgi:hypothetical protein